MRLSLDHGCQYVSSRQTVPTGELSLLLRRLARQFPNSLIMPGFCDVHVHLREPGFSYKETIASGTLAAARGGFTAVVTMPNLIPVPDSPEHLAVQLQLIEKDALIGVHPLGAVSVAEAGEELADLAGLAPHVCGFSDDGKGVQSVELMRQAMTAARQLNKIIVAHCEDESLARGAHVHDGAWSRQHGLTGNPSASEWVQLERDLALIRQTGCQYHVCHVSAKESVTLIRAAKAEGLPVTAETCPHYLLLCDEDLKDEGRFRMNPPIRGAEDRAALLEGLLDGTLDCVSTDHAPHSAAEKAGGLAGSLNGVVGLETAFAMLYTELVAGGHISLELLLRRMEEAPRQRFDIPYDSMDLTIWQLHDATPINPDDFVSLGKASPFSGRMSVISCRATLRGGAIIWRENEVND